MAGLSKRTKTFTDSVIRRMTRVSCKYNAVNLSQGFPDWAPPEALTARLAEVAAQGPHQYSITWGRRISVKLWQKNRGILRDCPLIPIRRSSPLAAGRKR